MSTDEDEELWKTFSLATDCRDRGDPAGAMELLEMILAQAQTRKLSGHAHLQLYLLHKNQKHLLEAEKHARDASVLLPSLELASLSLFNALFDLGRIEEALHEMLRFLHLRYSPLYEQLLSEGFRDDLSPHGQKLVHQARELLRRSPRT